MVSTKTLDRPGLQKAARGALHSAGLPIDIGSDIPRTHIFEALGAPDRCGVISCLPNLHRSFANLRLPPKPLAYINTLPRASAARSDERALVLRIEGSKTPTSIRQLLAINQKPISKPCRRMLDDLAVRQFSEATRRSSIHHIAAFAEFLGALPTRRPRMTCAHISERGARPPKFNSATLARPCFFGPSLDRTQFTQHRLPACTTPDRYRGCSSPEEIGLLP